MHIRPYDPSDSDALVRLTVDTFRAFYEESFPAMVGQDQRVITHQHGDWEGDYRREVPALHDPASRKHVAVAVDRDAVLGYVGWTPESERPSHGEITMLAVAEGARAHGVGRALVDHALEALRREGVEFVGLGTGGDDFHAPARALYSSMGFHPIPIMGYLRAL